MTELLQFALLGLAAGSLYALVGHGLVLTYKSSAVLNLSLGAIGMVGAYLYYEIGADWPLGLRVAAGVGVPLALNVLVQVVVMRRLRQASPLVRMVACLGVLFLILAVATLRFGDTGVGVVSPLPATIRHPFDDEIFISEDRLWTIGIAVVVTTGLWALSRCTSFGRQTEAVAENPRAAAGLGYSPARIAAVNWAIAGGLAGGAAILVAPVLLLQTAALAFVVLRSLAAALVGRFQSYWITLVAAWFIGVAEALLSRYVSVDGPLAGLTDDQGLLGGYFSGQSISRSVAFLVVVAVVALSGRSLPGRGEFLDRLPAVGSGVVRPWLLVVATSVGVVLLLALPDEWASASSASLATALILLSLVIVSGYTGQMSLAQVALAGLGAWAAGRLVDAAGLPLLLAVPAGMLCAIVVGVALALPATRTRGLNLAVITFGMSVCLVELVTTNPALNGGLDGTRIETLSVFGRHLDPFAQPGAYAVVVLLVLVAVTTMVATLRRSPTGRRMIAVRANERAAAALGVDVARTKLYAFAVAAAVAALGGMALAFRDHTIAYSSFGTVASIQAVILATIGGVGYLLGPVFAAGLANGGLGDQLVRSLALKPEVVDIAAGLILLLMVVASPDGLAHRPSRWLTRRRPMPPPAIDDAGPATDAPAGAHLSVKDLGVTFGGVNALSGVSFDVAPGEIVGLIGPNGAGKTTALDAVSGHVRAHGTVLLDGVRIDHLPPHARARHGLSRSFQSLELFEDLSIADNLLVACEPILPADGVRHLVSSGGRTLSPRASGAAEEFELIQHLNAYPGEISYGRRRLLAVARSIAAGPAALLLDEPAAGLSDIESRELGRLVVQEARERGTAVLIIEHDVDLIMNICDRIVVLDAGRVIANGRPDEVAADPLVLRAYLGSESDVTAPTSAGGEQ